jgi:lipopolysaccharide export system permease protein
MRLLDRYLLRELLIPLGYCLGGFMLFWVTADLFANLKGFREKSLQAGDIAQYYLIGAPETLVLVFPVALLLALLYALTNHARNQEITAIRAAGVSMWRLCLPYFTVGLLTTAAMFAVSEYWAPHSADAAEQVLARYQKSSSAAPKDQVRGFAFSNAGAGRQWQMGMYNTTTSEMLNPQVIWRVRDNTRVWLCADHAVYTNRYWLFSGNVRQLRDAPQTNDLPVVVLVTNSLAVAFSETPDQIRSEIRIGDAQVVLEAKKADIPISDILNYLRLHPGFAASQNANWLFTKLHARLAGPWTCLVVVLIAVPFGAASGRRNVFVGVAASILFCFSYFVLQRVGLALGSGGHVAPWLGAWFPNLAFGSAGIWMTARVR